MVKPIRHDGREGGRDGRKRGMRVKEEGTERGRREFVEEEPERKGRHSGNTLGKLSRWLTYYYCNILYITMSDTGQAALSHE